MKKYKVSATGIEYLEKIDIEASSKEGAEEIYRRKWDNGLIQAMDYDLKVKVKGDK